MTDTRETVRALYVISVAAELSGMHPQTLRIYERRGLVSPARTPGRSRRYSDEDINRLRRIAELTDAGISIAGVQYILSLEAQLDAARSVLADLDRARHAAHDVLPLSALLQELHAVLDAHLSAAQNTQPTFSPETNA